MVNGVLEVAWPQAAQLAGYRLQSTDTDAANGWDDVGLEPEPNGSEVRLRLSAAGEQRFFRLGR